MIRRAWYLVRQMRAERRPLERLRAYQLAHLKRLVSVGYARVPFYRALLEGAGVRPGDVTTLGDLERLPLVDKAMLRAVPEATRASRPLEAAHGFTRISTSGSQGTPFSFLVDRRYNDWRKAQYLRPYLSNGRRLCQRALRLTSHVDAAPSWPVRAGLLPERRVNCASPGREFLEALGAYRPQIVQGYPSTLRALARAIEDAGAEVPPVHRVFSDSEILTDGTRQLVASALGALVLDVYGSFEADNIAYECEHRRGLHLALDSVIAEIVDDSGAVLPDGETGELVVTILHNRLMPFIRYRTGDLARLLPDRCPCGRSFPLLALAGGRRYDTLTLRDGSRVSAMGLVDSLNDPAIEIVEFRIVQTAVDAVTVELVPATTTDRAALVRRARELVRAHVPDARVTVELVERVPRTAAGKLLAFTSRVDSKGTVEL